MPSTRTKDVRITKVVGGAEQPDTGRTDIYIKNIYDLADIISTATETPANSGQYRATWSAVNKWGRWYANTTPSYVEDIWMGELDRRRPAQINIFRKVEVYDAGDSPTGAKGSAKTFTTSVAPLATDSDGNSVFSFYTVPIVAIAGKYQERGAYISTDPTLSGNNVTFGISAEDAGENYSDGKTYVDIVVISRD